MKYIIVVLVFAFDFSALAAKRNQNSIELSTEKVNPYQLRYGVRAGMNISGASLDAPSLRDSGSSHVGLTAGALIEAPVIPGFLSFQPELNYIQKGAENYYFGTQATTKLHYVEVPLLAKVKLNIPSVKPFAVAGPSMAYLLSGNVSGPGVTSGTDRFSPIDLSFSFGGGVGFQLGDALNSTEAFLEARYTFALNNIGDSPSSWRSNGFALTGGVEF